MIRFWNRLVGLENNRLVKRVFEWDINMSNFDNNWSVDIEKVFYEMHLQYFFDYKCQVDINNVEIRVFDLQKEVWIRNMESKPKLHVYQTFKILSITEYHKERKVIPGTD